MEELDVLIAVQRDFIQNLNRMKARFDSKTSDITRGYVDTLAQELDTLFQQFKYQHEEITRVARESSIPVEEVPYLNEECFFDTQELYISFKGKLLDHFPHHEPTANNPFSSTFAVPQNHSEMNMSLEARLPKISLPRFSGEYTDWIPFRDIYVSMVHDKPSIPKIQKFYYLKSSLFGEAANLIKTISATEANYDSAWEILESRYHNKRIIVGTLTNKLFNIPKSDGTFQSIKTLLDTTQECLSSLKNLRIDTATWDPILINLLSQKLDQQTRKDWEQSLKSSVEIPTRSEMFSFLERTFRTLESLNNNLPSTSNFQKKFSTDSKFKNKRKTSVNTANIPQNKVISCLYCEKPHYLSRCYKFLALPFKSKNDFLSKKNICRNCFSLGHSNNNCSSEFRCMTCKEPHHTVLHVNGAVAVQNSSLNTSNDSANLVQDSSVTSHSLIACQNVLLYTIRLFVNTDRGQYPLRALLDPGSQGSLISESVVQLLGLSKQNSQVQVVGVGGNGTLSKHTVNLNLLSRNREPIIHCTALVLSNISSYTPNPYSKNLSLPNIKIESLADPFYYKTDPIDIILGSDICSKIKIPAESFVHNDLFFQNTYFGWVFSGSSDTASTNIINFHNVNLETILKSFWEQEEVVSKRDMTEEEKSCESYFKSTTKRTSDGRYMVNLPFKSILLKNSSPKIHNNMISAINRLKYLEISFSKRPLFAETYKAFMLEYESLGHMSKVGAYPDHVLENSYFLPHHGVFKEDSTTTKLRVVFDGSSHLQGQTSINEELSPGPALQNDLPQILTKWRRHKFAFSADIEKMFRQILVCPEHRQFQQVFWRSNPSDKISIYQLNTVTYGTAPAPYLSIRTLHQIAEDFKFEYPKESKVLVSDSYVDDIISGADTLEDAIELHRNLCSLLKKSGCNLRKWITNSTELFNEIPEDYREKSITLKFDRDNIVKTLGIQWNTTNDSFSFKVNIDETRSVSKRSILSDTARLYDPLGWLTPCTVVAKSLFKQLWEQGIDWDDKVPHEIEQKWLKYRNNLKSLSNLKIPRWINCTKQFKLELHCFSDASNIAYASAIYARVITINGIFVNLLQAKSKVSPIKTVSIPRLELCAATLLVKLAKKVTDAFSDLKIQNIFYWSDSSTVLSWIRKPPSRWTVYVANRVAEIQRLSNPIQWKYVPSALNPADCASRGIFPQELLQHKMWWLGPEFLYKSQSEWPKTVSSLETSEEKRKIKLSANVSTQTKYPDFLKDFSKLSKLLRVVSMCRRFCYNCKNPASKETGPLKATTLTQTLHFLIKLTQPVDFPEDIKMLSTKGEVKQSPLLKLMPFIDSEGLIRVGGRLQNSDFTYDVKHPVLLAKNNPISKLIILDAHEKTLHGGKTLTMSYVNRKFWIVSGNQLAKNIIHKCMKCFKYSAKTAGQIMGNLPSVRLNATRPFKHSGVDYAGPISIKNSTLRSAVISKGYICLFICMVTKAIHLEPVSGLSTNAFLAAFRRFISRRGACTNIYSDNGTNFVGASKELQVLYNNTKKSLPEDLRENLSSIGTDWHFIPPASPNFGGLWEAGVKSVKYHLKRIMNDRVLSFEELTTLLCQIESCLNSRPLCPLSSDPSDFNALTPAHFLIGEPTNCIPEESLLQHNINHLSRWKGVEKIKQHFWKRWHLEYINRLQARPKWLKSKPDAKVGDLVLIADDKCGPGQWNLGRIKEVHPGPDAHVRVISIFSKNKIVRRPISKICFLPTDSTPENEDPNPDIESTGQRMEPSSSSSSL